MSDMTEATDHAHTHTSGADSSHKGFMDTEAQSDRSGTHELYQYVLAEMMSGQAISGGGNPGMRTRAESGTLMIK